VRTHRIPAAQFDALAAGYGDAAAIHTLRDTQLSKRLLLLRAVAGAAGAEADPAVAVLRAAQRQAPAAVRDVLRHPFLDTWARRVLGGDPTAGPGRLVGYAAAAAAAAGVDADLEMPAEHGWVLLPGLGTARTAGVARVRSAAGRLVVESGSNRIDVPASADWVGIRRAAFRAAGQELTIIVDDVDPLRACYSAPVTDRLTVPAWRVVRRRLAAAWRLISTDHPVHAEALAAAPITLVPLRRPGPGSEVSGTARTAFGAFGASIPDSPAALAEAILHEFAHIKLGGLLDLVDLHDPIESGRYFAGWHADLRPIGLLLQGTYAHLAVADFWRLHRHRLTGPAREAADYRYALNLARVTDALATLDISGELTNLGHRVTTAMAATTSRWSSDLPPAVTREAAARHLVGRRATHLKGGR
jgi:uncharacterized protein